MSIQADLIHEPTPCSSECQTHSGDAIMRVDVGGVSMRLCEECCHKLFVVVGVMTSSVSRLTVAEMAGIKKRPKAFKFNGGEWKP